MIRGSWRNRLLVRNLQLVRLLQTRRLGVSLAELADEFGVCQRTIRRDLAALEEAHFPLVQTETGGYRLLGD